MVCYRFKSFLRNFMRPSYYLLTCKLYKLNDTSANSRCMLRTLFYSVIIVCFLFLFHCYYQRLLAEGSFSHYCLRCMFVLYLPKTSGAVNLQFLLQEHYYLEARLWGVECMTKQRWNARQREEYKSLHNLKSGMNRMSG